MVRTLQRLLAVELMIDTLMVRKSLGKVGNGINKQQLDGTNITESFRGGISD